MSSRRIEDLAPELQPLCIEWGNRCAAKGIAVIITCTARSYQEQMSLYAQGRQPLDEVNKLRLLAGLPPITSEQNKRQVTWTMLSQHIINLQDDRPDNDKARAFDFAVMKGKEVEWDVKADVNGDDIPDYTEAGRIGEELGLVWGGSWGEKNRDFPHLQLPNGSLVKPT